MTGLDLLTDALMALESADPRQQQVESGASQTFGCRAATALRLSEIPHSNPHIGLASLMGKGFHSLTESALRTLDPELIVERRLVYRGVPATVDCINPRTRRLSDWKTAWRDDILAYKHDGVKEQSRGQVHLGAAAAIEAGIPVDTVSLVFVPRDSNKMSDCWEWSEPFSQEWADRGVAWHEEQNTRPRLDVTADLRPQLDGLRDEPLSWCESVCPWVTACRGDDRALETDDPEVIELAQRFLAAKWEADEAYARKRHYQELLEKLPPIVVDGWKMAWSGGNPKTKTEVDEDELRAAFELMVGPLPMKETTTVTARSFRTTKAKK